MRSLFRPPRLLAATLALFVALAANTVAALPPGIAAGPVVEGISQYTLDNGLTVLLFPDATKPVTTVSITYRVGSRHEGYGETGMAHLLEHMLFKGTPRHKNLMQELGKRGMNFNGTTSFDRTNYFQTFPASEENLEWALAMEADRMVNSYVARADLDTEMTVVRNEFERWNSNPRSVLWGRMQAVAFDWHNYGNLSIGSRADIENVSIERLQAFYRLYYQPDNAVLVVAGRFDPARALDLIARDFGPVPRPARTLPALYTAEPVQDGERMVSVRRVGGSKLLGVLYRTMPGAHPDAVAMDALGDIMTVAPSGRLYKALVETKKATSVDAWNFTLHDPGVIIFWAVVAGEDSLEAAQRALQASLADIAKDPITVAEVERIRAKALKEFDDTLNNPQRFAVALSEAIAKGDWRLFFLERDLWKKLTPQDVQRVALAYLKPANATIGHYIPDASPDRAPEPPRVDVAALVKDYKGESATAAGEAFDPSPANLDTRTERFVLRNGLRVALLPKKTRGATVNVALRLHFGDVRSLAGRQTEGSLTAAMLMRGTREHSRQEIEDTLDRLRSRLSVGGSETGVGASGQTVRENLAATLGLLAEVLREPAFPAAELEQIRRARLTSLEQQRADPRALARRALARHNNPYPPGDPRYAPTLDEEIAALKSIDVEGLRRFHRQFYGASAGEIALVGDFDPAEAKALLAKLFGDWAPAAPYTRVPSPFIANVAAAIPIETPDKPNAILVGNVALPVNDESPDYPALLVMNFLLGDSTDSRILNRLRQKDGVSYAAGASLQPSSHEPNSDLGVYAIFAPENLERVRRGFREELLRAVKEGFTEREVSEARQGLLQERRLGRASDAALASGLVAQLRLGRTFARSGEVDAAIETMTAEAVNAVTRKYLKPDELAVVFAGDFAKHRK